MKKFSNFNNKILATSESEKNRAIEDVHYSPKKVIVFNNCINEISDIKELSIPQTWPDEYICSVGRPSYQKNIELMIHVLSEVVKIKKTHLVLMGVGHHSDKLEDVKSLINKLELEEYVTIIEWTERENIFNIITAKT